MSLDKSMQYIAVFCYLVLAFAIFDGFFALPSADDFIYANRSSQYGVLGAVIFEFNHWAGRFFSTFLLTAYSHFFNLINQFWIIPVSLILLTYLSFRVFFSVLKINLEKKYINFLALLLCTLFILTVPRLSQTFYWMAGGFTYQMGNILFLFSVTLWIRWHNHKDSIVFRTIAFILSIALVILYSGTNETLALVSLVILFYIIFYLWHFKHKFNVFFLILFIVNLLTLLVIINAPGVASRGGAQLGQTGFILSSIFSYYSGLKFFLLSSFVLYLVTASTPLVAFSNLVIKYLHHFFITLSGINKLLALFFYVSIFAVIYFPGYWARGDEPPQRALNILVLIAVLGWYPFVALVMELFKFKEFKYPLIKFNFIYHIISFISLIIFLVKLNFLFIVKDIYLAPKSYVEQKKTIDLIEKTRKSGELNIELEPLTIHPQLTRQFINNETQWANSAVAKYFKVESIKVDKK